MKTLLGCIIILYHGICFPQEIKKQPDVPNAKNRPIIIVGDSQHANWIEFWREKNNGIAKSIFDKIADENPLCILHMGDMVFNGASKNQWKNFDKDAANVVSQNFPIYPVLGNHEYYGRNKTALVNLIHRFPEMIDRTWYSERFGDVGIIFLNSNFDELSNEENSDQLLWYNNELESLQSNTGIDFIIVICHHPPYTNSTINKDNIDVQKNFVDAFNKSSKTKLFLSGHTHAYEHFIRDDKHFIVSGGGGGPRHKLKPRNHPANIYNTASIREFNYCKIFSSGEELKFEMIKLDKKTKIFLTGDTLSVHK